MVRRKVVEFVLEKVKLRETTGGWGGLPVLVESMSACAWLVVGTLR